MENFTDSISKIIKLVHPDIKISNDAKLMLNRVANKFLLHFDDIIFTSFQDTELKHNIVEQGQKAVTNYNKNPNMINPAKAANLQISPKKVEKVLPHKDFKEILYISGGLEYFLAEILDIAGYHTAKITPKHIVQTIFGDEEIIQVIEILCG